MLAEFGFGRAHHRVLHFVNRRPGLRVADLLDILRITKQSLARVLKELVDRGFIAQEAGADDRRERRLYLTHEGPGAGRASWSACRPRGSARRWPQPAGSEPGGRSATSWPASSVRRVQDARERHADREAPREAPGNTVGGRPHAAKRSSQRDAAGASRCPTTRRTSCSSTTTSASASCWPSCSTTNGFRVTPAAESQRCARRDAQPRVRSRDARRDDAGQSGIEFAQRAEGAVSPIPILHADREVGDGGSRSRAWRPASTTTCRSRSSRASCCCGSRTSCGAAGRRQGRPTRSGWASIRSTSAAAS